MKTVQAERRGGRRVRPPLVAALLAAATAACGAAPEPVRVGPETTVVATGGTLPTVAVDPGSGRRYVAWVGLDGGISNVFLASAEPGSNSYGSPVVVNNVPGDAAAHEQAPAQVAVAADGRVYVLWQNNQDIEGRQYPASDLRLAVSADGGRSFAPAVTVNDDAGGPPSSHTFHDLAVAADGTVYVSWIDSRERDLAAAALPDGGAGHEAHLPGPEIRVTRSTDGGRTFEASVVVDDSSCPCCRTSLAVGPDGSVYVAWRRVFDGDVRDIVVARASPGELAFSPPVPVHADGWVFPGCPHAGPSLAVDDAGRLHAAWYTGREGRQGLWHVISEDRGESFGPPAPLLTADWVPPSMVKLAAAGDDVWAVWDDRREESTRIEVARWNTGSRAWRPTSAGAGRAPSIAAAAGTLLVGWLDRESVRARTIEAAP